MAHPLEPPLLLSSSLISHDVRGIIREFQLFARFLFVILEFLSFVFFFLILCFLSVITGAQVSMRIGTSF